jgi:hypothetical protein
MGQLLFHRSPRGSLRPWELNIIHIKLEDLNPLVRWKGSIKQPNRPWPSFAKKPPEDGLRFYLLHYGELAIPQRLRSNWAPLKYSVGGHFSPRTWDGSGDWQSPKIYNRSRDISMRNLGVLPSLTGGELRIELGGTRCWSSPGRKEPQLTNSSPNGRFSIQWFWPLPQP